MSGVNSDIDGYAYSHSIVATIVATTEHMRSMDTLQHKHFKVCIAQHAIVLHTHFPKKCAAPYCYIDALRSCENCACMLAATLLASFLARTFSLDVIILRFDIARQVSSSHEGSCYNLCIAEL